MNQLKMGMNSAAPEEQTVLAPLMAPVMLLMLKFCLKVGGVYFFERYNIMAIFWRTFNKEPNKKNIAPKQKKVNRSFLNIKLSAFILCIPFIGILFTCR